MPWEDIAKYAPIATATVAVAASIIAVISIYVQRNLARRRASIDFFLKTEMDVSMLKAWNDYNAAIRKLKEVLLPAEKFAVDFPQEYECIRAYLNIHELVAAGIYNRIFDNRICFDFWANVLTRACVDAREIIIHARSSLGHEYTYHSLTWLNKKWICRKRRWVGVAPVGV